MLCYSYFVQKAPYTNGLHGAHWLRQLPPDTSTFTQMTSTPLAQAIILAAGRGERMRPLTDTCPKPLLQVHGKPLMQWHVQALLGEGFAQQLVNTAWLGDAIEKHFESLLGSLNSLEPASNMREQLLNSEQNAAAKLADLAHLAHLHLRYSHEGRDFGGALETAGGICRALPQLADVFWVVAGDVYCPTFRFSRAAYDRFTASPQLAHLWLVPNPPHNPRGDFGLSAAGLAQNLPKDAGHPLYTYSTIGLYKHAFFSLPFCNIPLGNPKGEKAPLAPMLRAAMDTGLVSAEIFAGEWIDVGTPERLAELNAG